MTTQTEIRNQVVNRNRFQCLTCQPFFNTPQQFLRLQKTKVLTEKTILTLENSVSTLENSVSTLEKTVSTFVFASTAIPKNTPVSGKTIWTETK